MGLEDVVARIHGGPIRRVKSTLICSSIETLKTLGHFDAYRSHLEPAAAGDILDAVAGTWLPIDTGTAHYAACDALGLDRAGIAAIGTASIHRLQHSVFNTLGLLAQQVGANPWTVFPAYPRLWSRHFDGGGVTVTKLGPKDALCELRDLPFCRFPYFRIAHAAQVRFGTSRFASTVHVREHAATANSLSLAVSWV